jgi:hypothetical protein
MISDNAIAGAAIFILMIVGANFFMYAIAHDWARKGGNARWIDALKQGLTKPMESQRNKSMDELRQEIEKLEKKSEKEE